MRNILCKTRQERAGAALFHASFAMAKQTALAVLTVLRLPETPLQRH